METAGEAAPRVEVLTLVDGAYVRAVQVSAGETVVLTEPFKLSFDPAELAGPRRPR